MLQKSSLIEAFSRCLVINQCTLTLAVSAAIFEMRLPNEHASLDFSVFGNNASIRSQKVRRLVLLPDSLPISPRWVGDSLPVQPLNKMAVTWGAIKVSKN